MRVRQQRQCNMSDLQGYNVPMRQILIRNTLILLLCAVLLIGVRGDASHAPSIISHVLLISLDGARPDAIQQADTPHMDALAARGAVAWEATTVFPPATVPAHASMLTGMSVAEHGIMLNVYSKETIAAPTFLFVTHDAGHKTAMVAGKNKLEQFRQREDIPFIFATEGDRSVVDAVIALLDEDYAVILAHFPNPDFFGHLTGWMSDTYLYELSNTDYQIGRLLDALDERDLTDHTLIIITADHGGHDRLHGLNIPEDMRIPWLIAGPGVRSGAQLDDVTVTDTAHTILWALGLPLPDSDAGRPVIEAFTEESVREHDPNPDATPVD